MLGGQVLEKSREHLLSLIGIVDCILGSDCHADHERDANDDTVGQVLRLVQFYQLGVALFVVCALAVAVLVAFCLRIAAFAIEPVA